MMRSLGGLEKSLDPQLWHACAGSMVQIPAVNSVVFYFPQGHLEHCQSQPPREFSFPKSTARIPAYIPCKVSAINYLADPETDEVYTKIAVVPLPTTHSHSILDLNSADEYGEVDEKGVHGRCDTLEKPASFAKTLTQSDANNGGGFSVPRYCAETIFPRLDYTADPPVQTVMAKDVHGEVWRFRHIYRGTPRRHLLTTGWSTFVNQKKLVAGDSIVFLRSDSGELRVGIRRAKRSITGPEWSGRAGSCLSPYGGFWIEDDCKRSVALKGKGMRIQEVLEATSNAVNGKPFEVVYYPRASTPEFFVKAAAVREAMRNRWCPGMRFKMAFETEDSSRISWFMGTVASAQVSDPIHWPNSPWRLLQVNWDEPDLLQSVKRVNPWLVELVSNMPAIHMSPYSPPRKKLRLPQQMEAPLDGQFLYSPYSGGPLGGPSSPLRLPIDSSSPAGIQGTRQGHRGMLVSDLQLSNKLQSGLFLAGFQPSNAHPKSYESFITKRTNSKENLSCLLTMGNSDTNSKKSSNKEYQFLLFGQPILTEQQLSRNTSGRKLMEENPGKRTFLDMLQLSSEKQASIQKLSNSGFPWQQKFRAFVPCNTGELVDD